MEHGYIVSVDTSITADLSSEVSRAESAEGSLATTIANVISNADPAALDSLVEIVNAFQSAALYSGNNFTSKFIFDI
jgi:hypothetical protein